VVPYTISSQFPSMLLIVTKVKVYADTVITVPLIKRHAVPGQGWVSQQTIDICSLERKKPTNQPVSPLESAENSGRVKVRKKIERKSRHVSRRCLGTTGIV